MTPQEREHLTTFLQQMTQTQPGQKDAEADALIRDASVRQPDAAYLLVQRAMGLEYALQATHAQAAKLQAELEQLRAGGGTRSSFLDAANSWGRAASATAAQGPLASAARAPVQAAGSPGPTAGPAAAPASSWGSGMLGTIATTAAGVVAGSFLFQGIQGLMGHRGPGESAKALEPAGANAMQPQPESVSGFSPVQAEAASAAEESSDYAASDGGDYGSGDSGDAA